MGDKSTGFINFSGLCICLYATFLLTDISEWHLSMVISAIDLDGYLKFTSIITMDPSLRIKMKQIMTIKNLYLELRPISCPKMTIDTVSSMSIARIGIIAG